MQAKSRTIGKWSGGNEATFLEIHLSICCVKDVNHSPVSTWEKKEKQKANALSSIGEEKGKKRSGQCLFHGSPFF